jgi:trimeric autotransporter adhesin
MSIRKFRAARVTTTNANIYVGQQGDMFYDERTGLLKISDGHTAGGHYVSVLPATSTLVGGIKAGPGANVSVDGTLTIDTTGIPLSVGDLYIAQANISTANANEDLNLISNGTGNVNLIGNLRVQTTSAGLYSTPVFSVDNRGNLTVNGNLITNGNTFLNGTVTFIGATVHQGNIVTTGNLITNGASYFYGPVTEVGNLTITGNANIAGPASYYGAQTTVGNSTFLGNITANGNLTINGTTTFNGATIRNGDSTTTGNLTVYGITTNNGPTVNNGMFTQTGNILVTGNSVFVVTLTSSNYGGVEITGNAQGLSQPPQNSGVMLHTTGPDNGSTSSRAYFDSNGNYTVIAGRRYNGTIANPTQVLAGQDIVRYGGTPYGSSGWPTIGPSRISYVANEDQTATNQGGRIEFWTTANGTVASTNISRTATIDPALGVTATGFVTTGNVTAGNVIISGNETVTGNVAAGNLIATTYYGNVVGTTATLSGNVTAANVNATLHGNVVGVATGLATAGTTAAGTFLTGQLSISPSLIAKTSAATQTFTITGLTTSHKIVISPANDLTYGIFITAAYVSGANTVSIQFQNTTNGGVTPATMNINYFAWV